MSEVRIAAEPRTEFGKGPSRRIRRANKVPAVLYGHGEQPRHFTLPGHELMLALKHDANALLTLQTEDGDQLALPKVIVRDPIKNTLEHVDLVAVRKGEKVTVEIPVQLTGDAAPETLVDQQTMTLTVTADATALPDHLELSIAGKRAGSSLAAKDVTLPAGTELAQDPEHVIVAILGVISEEELEAELVAAEEDLGSGQAGAEAIEAEAAEAGDVEVGSESDAAGEGDVVGETDAPTSETPAQ
ncbi:MAG: ribosomal rRNA e-loop binding protein ctc/l25/tl5 [Frankiales bacterium]|nr:ribosomal rRNA e-loop binding protein ctc/l25/tl5 [Frankiales bacterium]